MNKYYRKRTPEQVQKKVDKLKTQFMVNKVMGTNKDSILERLSRVIKFKRSRKRSPSFDAKEVRRIKRLERKVKRMKDGKWRQGRTGSQNT